MGAYDWMDDGSTLNPAQFSEPTALGDQEYYPEYGDGLYHGTVHDVTDNRILPANLAGKEINHQGLSNPRVAYATENENTAWTMGHLAGQRRGGVVPRTRVYSLAPNPRMRVGVYHPDHPDNGMNEDLQEWVAPHFDVETEINTKPGHQGTLNLNWNQFAVDHGRYHFGDPFNHPNDEEVEHGHTDLEGNRPSDYLRARYVEPTNGEDPHQGRLF